MVAIHLRRGAFLKDEPQYLHGTVSTENDRNPAPHPSHIRRTAFTTLDFQ